MYSISANRNQVAHNTKKFIVDFASDVATLPTDCAPGSTAFVIENSSHYMLNNYKQWVKVILNTGGGTSGGGGGDVITDVIYDGGTI